MSMNCEFIDLIVTFEKIDVVNPGGFQKFKEGYSETLGLQIVQIRYKYASLLYTHSI